MFVLGRYLKIWSRFSKVLEMVLPEIKLSILGVAPKLQLALKYDIFIKSTIFTQTSCYSGNFTYSWLF